MSRSTAPASPSRCWRTASPTRAKSCPRSPPMAPGTKVRFCFRGHGHSGTPEAGHYRFADFAGDVDAVARAYGATRAVGTSLGSGSDHPAAVRGPGSLRTARVHPARRLGRAAFRRPRSPGSNAPRICSKRSRPTTRSKRSCGARDRASEYEDRPWLRDVDMLLWQDLQPLGVARALREVTLDVAIADRELLRRVNAPTLVIAREGDPIHPAELGRVLGELIPNSEPHHARLGGRAVRVDPRAGRPGGSVPRMSDRPASGSGRPNERRWRARGWPS